MLSRMTWSPDARNWATRNKKPKVTGIDSSACKLLSCMVRSFRGQRKNLQVSTRINRNERVSSKRSLPSIAFMCSKAPRPVCVSVSGSVFCKAKFGGRNGQEYSEPPYWPGGPYLAPGKVHRHNILYCNVNRESWILSFISDALLASIEKELVFNLSSSWL